MRGVIWVVLSADRSGMGKHYLYIGIFAAMTACAPQSHQALDNIASNTASDISCKSQQLESKLYDGLKSYLIEQQAIPTADEMKAAFHSQVDKLADENSRMTGDQKTQLNSNLDQLVDSLLVEAPTGERVTDSATLLQLLSAIDVGDRSTTFRAYMQDRVRANFTALQKTVQSMSLDCNTSSSTSAVAADDMTTPSPAPNYDYNYQKQQATAAGVNAAVFGERWAFATAYQSCQTLTMEPLSSKTPNIQGITITGKHSDGIGNKRMISSLAKVDATHPYIKDVASYGESCFDVRSNPLIYDYGGKPYVTTATSSPIDLFKNGGDGTSVLGIDCSGFVFTSMAAGGLRLKSGRTLKASDALAWGSTSYVEPQNNGLTCLSKITVTPTTSLHAGDIVAVQGHVIMIDKVGADPFGIANAKTTSDCSALTSKGFDFVIAQSSPSVGAVGINHFVAKDYLPTESKMDVGLTKYAYYACLAKINNKSYTPNLGTLSVVRHKGTSDCIDTRVALAHESCIQSCSSASFAD